MAVYSAFYNGDIADLDGKGLVLLKSGFNWWAFLISPIWALWHRLWWALLVYVFASLFIELGQVLLDLPEFLLIAVSLAFSVLFACYAEMFRAEKLKKQGYRELYPVEAGSLEQAEEKVLRRLIKNTEPERVSTLGTVDDYNY
ncbi:DUF2628 domain-containing protein [Sneathiella limimaris]|uniref:DUF2628 domain-containing protein n=1 Tax=Sneathiella limimaris TaxID=1964213 RepID=UPI00146BD671|nr:DUF2628 domain-containing protein [Sneathiella limimaris]